MIKTRRWGDECDLASDRGKQLTDRGKKYIAIRKLDLLGKWNYFEHLNIFLNYISL